jgi:hypothetical protein
VKFESFKQSAKNFSVLFWHSLPIVHGTEAFSRGGYGKSKIKFTNSIVKMDRLPDPSQERSKQSAGRVKLS